MVLVTVAFLSLILGAPHSVAWTGHRLGHLFPISTLQAHGVGVSASAAVVGDEIGVRTVNGDTAGEKRLPSDENLPSSPPLSFQKFLTMQVGEEEVKLMGILWCLCSRSFVRCSRLTFYFNASSLFCVHSHFVVMVQEKRVLITVRYTGLTGLRPFFLTVAKKIKSSNPDVIVEKDVLPVIENSDEILFEILVDGKVVIGKGRSKKQSVHRSGSGDANLAGGLSVFVSMEDINLAIGKARRRRRPASVYSHKDAMQDGEIRTPSAVRLEMLRTNREIDQADK